MAGFKYNIDNNAAFYSVDGFGQSNKVKAITSTRIGGVSEGTFYSLNTGYKSGDEKYKIDENIKILCHAAGFEMDELVLTDQVHGSNCRVVTAKDCGKGIIKESDIKAIDALTTNEKEVGLCIFTADCVPVFLYDNKNEAIAVIHAGWRGVVSKIINNTIELMNKTYGTSGEDIIAAIGPSIGPCCFEVNGDVKDKFVNLFGKDEEIIIKYKERYKLNLWNAINKQLLLKGIQSKKIINSNLCTSCNHNEFYSYRRDGSQTGRMVSMLKLI
ncbi:laccase domain protein YfiH [Oxobacter pfennigii]|uniref:Purine nucleoside phosphorylase n=1 Tax=Oxobacter pfennigii TaxID=36849 RepID=A0A0P8W7J8_9CLOT|nr:peptidoglycan editing factor PgeF [Oxobacter pfennigii]KPU44026.1 laccase domain protein YfiH [Oxobacter pfennigii]